MIILTGIVVLQSCIVIPLLLSILGLYNYNNEDNTMLLEWKSINGPADSYMMMYCTVLMQRYHFKIQSLN